MNTPLTTPDTSFYRHAHFSSQKTLATPAERRAMSRHGLPARARPRPRHVAVDGEFESPLVMPGPSAARLRITPIESKLASAEVKELFTS